MEKLTNKDYWESNYRRRRSQVRLKIDGFANRSNRLILKKLLELSLDGKRILEIGAGDSLWLTYLAKQFPSSKFVGLDYTEAGCALLFERASAEKVDVEVIHEDMFVEISRLHKSFDAVISFGVVEHFDNLASVLSVKRRYLKDDGLLFTLIPNMSGVLGALARKCNHEVYDIHNPHDLNSFLLSHQQARLEVISGGYLGSSNFGVLSGCFPERQGLSWQLSRALVAASLASWWIEDRVGNLPCSRIVSPYIYAISKQV